MNHRLKKARQQAGYKTTASAVRALRFNESRYRAHENGQNRFDVHDAKLYAKAYKVSASWLLLGDEEEGHETSCDTAQSINVHDHDCLAQIQELVKLLKDDRNNNELVQQLDSCVQALKSQMRK
jgi:hypothetical protein